MHLQEVVTFNNICSLAAICERVGASYFYMSLSQFRETRELLVSFYATMSVSLHARLAIVMNSFLNVLHFCCIV